MNTFDLIAGEYTPLEAKEILFKTIESKINFHELKSFSSLMRLGYADEKSEARLEELREAKKQVIAMVEKATQENTTLKIQATVHVVPGPTLQSSAHVQRQEVVNSN
ncbi:hypothetical protein ACXYMU_05425 [Pontibacter sp. CAU 1760]